MKTRVALVFAVILIIIPYYNSYGQKTNKRVTISGYVVDGTQSSVANAIVTVDGQKTDVLTNDKGYYKIKVKPGSSKIGILTLTNGALEEEINGRTRINFQFEGSVPDQVVEKAGTDDDVVDIGYGKVKRKDVTSNVNKIDGNNPKYASYRNIYDMIRGEVPGVQVVGNSIKIQGASSLTLSTEPLYVVDGVTVNSIDNILPYQVKSIQVLKGSSASIYGSRGANGVIVINLVNSGDR
jgi:TonB-dependent SusC/RagA subfamily outer membrane receptor